ncbi:hypothetical protein SAMN05443574_10846 [Haloarcula vallismortis]|uniref:Uncharacterized protein n=2 Tax=Haloarcula vallismortis TaxID=28442 RepID=M0JD12_HALVA|nr:hypothetical protein [Haloarcula vallismortis]EMA05550.1 hypothetical protein C437_12890 [Haloarcula vallismortis ATCC 29715]SDW86085.1 hypothetical protein SAMN05443574_10846 [Haloarcula vallismortis]
MTDRQAELRTLSGELTDSEGITDAFLAKSFTDQLLIVDVRDGEPLPTAVADQVADRDLLPADEVYGEAAANQSAIGNVGDATRHHFVDVRTRGSHRSYVVE